jgi:hypothetical protein
MLCATLLCQLQLPTALWIPSRLKSQYVKIYTVGWDSMRLHTLTCGSICGADIGKLFMEYGIYNYNLKPRGFNHTDLLAYP